MKNQTNLIRDFGESFEVNRFFNFLKSQLSEEYKLHFKKLGGVELELSKNFSLESLIEPLFASVFPQDNYYDYVSVLTSMVISCSEDVLKDEKAAIERVYLCSLYIYCYLKDVTNTQDGIMPTVCTTLFEAYCMLNFEGKLFVLRFLHWIILIEENEFDEREDYPRLSIALTTYLTIRGLSEYFGKEVLHTLKSEDKIERHTIRGTSVEKGLVAFQKMLKSHNYRDTKIVKGLKGIVK